MNQIEKDVREKVREKDFRRFEMLTGIIALLTDAVCVLFLFGPLQSRWTLNFALGLGILLHLSVNMIFLVQRKHLLFLFNMAMLIVLTGSLLYFNFL